MFLPQTLAIPWRTIFIRLPTSVRYVAECFRSPLLVIDTVRCSRKQACCTTSSDWSWCIRPIAVRSTPSTTAPFLLGKSSCVACKVPNDLNDLPLSHGLAGTVFLCRNSPTVQSPPGFHMNVCFARRQLLHTSTSYVQNPVS